MNLLCLLIILLTTAHARVDKTWLSANCPSCTITQDGFLLAAINKQFVKFDISVYGKAESLISDRIDILWIGVANSRGKILKSEMSFVNAGEKEKAMHSFQNLCRKFNGYENFSSDLMFSHGDHFSPPDQLTRGSIKQTCSKEISFLVQTWRSFLRSRKVDRPQINSSERNAGKEITPGKNSSRSPAKSVRK